MSSMPLLDVRNLSLSTGSTQLLRDISFQIFHGEKIAIVGESGSGKTLLVSTLSRMLKPNFQWQVSGDVFLNNQDFLHCSEKELILLRRKTVSCLLQESLCSLNPIKKVRDQIIESAMLGNQPPEKDCLAKSLAIRWLEGVNIENPVQRVKWYPHQFSGGMRQRIALACALASRPQLLIADEPTSALDCATQIDIVNLLTRHSIMSGMAILMITHDLLLAKELCDRILVMYGGQIIEMGTSQQIMEYPTHPYTQSLLAAIPTENMDKKLPLKVLPGSPLQLGKKISGCSFAPRCPNAKTRCFDEAPAWTLTNHLVRCWEAETCFSR